VALRSAQERRLSACDIMSNRSGINWDYTMHVQSAEVGELDVR
jgi:hypothetical protein